MRRPANPEAFLAAKLARETLPPGVISFDAWAAKAPKKKKGLRPTARDSIATSIDEADAMRAKASWPDARPRHLVALHVLCHRHVYGVDPGELSGKTWTAACLSAARLLEREFSGDVVRLVEFIAWSWKREKRAHAKGSDERRRMGWRLQFSSALVTDYRVQIRTKKTG